MLNSSVKNIRCKLVTVKVKKDEGVNTGAKYSSYSEFFIIVV